MLPTGQRGSVIACQICKNPILQVSDLLMTSLGEVHKICFGSTAGMNNTKPFGSGIGSAISNLRVCKFCNSLIQGDFSRIGSVDFHSHCLNCPSCGKPRLRLTPTSEICICAFKSAPNTPNSNSSSLSNYSTPTKEKLPGISEKNICAVCRGPFLVSDKILKINGVRIHQRCAAAKQSNFNANPIGNNSPGSKEKLPTTPNKDRPSYTFSAENSNEKKNTPEKEKPSDAICVICRLQVPSGELIMRDQLRFHEKCLKCEVCFKFLREQQFYLNRNFKVKCIPCKEKESIPKTVLCKGCTKGIIEKEYLNVLGNPFHFECFNCQDCRNRIRGLFYFTQNKYLCEPCYLKKPKLCFACNKPILRRTLFNKDGFWHFECFGCFLCKQAIGDAPYVLPEGKPAHLVCMQSMKGAQISRIVAKSKHKPIVPDNHLVLKKKLSEVKEEELEESVIYEGELLKSQQASEILNSVELDEGYYNKPF